MVTILKFLLMIVSSSAYSSVNFDDVRAVKAQFEQLITEEGLFEFGSGIGIQCLPQDLAGAREPCLKINVNNAQDAEVVHNLLHHVGQDGRFLGVWVEVEVTGPAIAF